MSRGVAYRQRVAAGFALVLAARVASGEVATDGSLGPAQGIAAVSNEYSITDTLGRYGDESQTASLFHSFSLFDVEEGRTASFSALRTPERVIVRVTGGSISQIDGRLRTTEGAAGADLFLLNPSGVTFGPRASLDLRGSFHVSTAERLHFVSGPDFDATSSAPDAALSIAAPSAFGFLGSAPAPINFSQTSGLSLPVGETFSAIGGPVRLTGSNRPGIRIPSGRIQLAAVDHRADVPLDLASFGGAALEAAVAADEIPDVTIEQGFNLDVSGDFAAAGPAGQVVIRGGSLLVAGSRIDATHRSAQAASAPAIDIQMANGVDVRSGARFTSQGFLGAGRGADVVIEAGLVQVRDAGTLVQTQTLGSAAGGDLRITADAIEVSGGGSLLSLAAGSGPGGGLVLVAAQGVRVFDGGSLQSSTTAAGEGGRIFVAATTVDVTDAGLIVSEAKAGGSGGDIVIEADRVFVSNETDRPAPAAIATLALASGAGGDLTLSVRELELARGGSVSTRTDAAGAGGNLTVQGAGESLTVQEADRVLVVGVDAAGRRASLRATTNPGSAGPGGWLMLGARVVELGNGGQISTLTQGTGDAGSLTIDASERLTVSGGANGASIISADSRVVGEITPIPGGAGDLSVHTGSLELRAGGQISASTEGARNSGRIRITADSVVVSGSDPAFGNASGVFSRSNADFVGGGDAQGIEIAATGDVILSQRGTLSSSTVATGDAGTIDVNAGGRIMLEDGAEISARAEGDSTGNGGSIELKADGGIFLSGDSSILAESQGSGLAGDVTLQAGPRLELRDSSIKTEAGSGSGGRITIHAAEIVWLRNSSLLTSVLEGEGGGGDIVIDPEFVVLDGHHDSHILANAKRGAGGNISITAGTFFKTPGSTVDASSTLGIDGSVSIVAPDTDVTSGITTLPSVFLDATALLRNACSAASGEGGSFVVSTRPGLPISPDAPLTAFAGAVTAAGIANATPASHAAARVALAGEYRARGCGRAREEVL